MNKDTQKTGEGLAEEPGVSQAAVETYCRVTVVGYRQRACLFIPKYP